MPLEVSFHLPKCDSIARLSDVPCLTLSYRDFRHNTGGELDHMLMAHALIAVGVYGAVVCDKDVLEGDIGRDLR
jgi:hypothetical protein